MFQSSFSTTSSYGDPTFCCSTGQPTITMTSAAVPSHAYFDGSHPSPPFSSSLPSNNYFMHRSSSTHSLTYNTCIPDPTPNPFFSSSPSSACDFLDLHSEPVRRVFSTGDLQGMNSIQVSAAENCIQEGAANAGRVGRYSAEERKERIDRYRSKRNQRNFHKKITYACRKTLADSRPRVRGRFARNGETETETEAEMEAETTAENGFERSYNNHSNYDNGGNYTNNHDNNGGDWWKQMESALTTTDEEEYCCYDDDLWASYVDSVFSMNLLS